MLRAEEALDPTVSTRSKPGDTGERFSSLMTIAPGRRAKGFRIGILSVRKTEGDRDIRAVEGRVMNPDLTHGAGQGMSMQIILLVPH